MMCECCKCKGEILTEADPYVYQSTPGGVELTCYSCYKTTPEQKVSQLEQQLAQQKALLNEAHIQLKEAHAHIVNLQDAFNECRSWFSNVEYIPETEDLDEYISMDNCDETEAVRLKEMSEDYVMDCFRYWYSLVNEKHDLKSLEEYNRFKDENLPEFKQAKIEINQILGKEEGEK